MGSLRDGSEKKSDGKPPSAAGADSVSISGSSILRRLSLGGSTTGDVGGMTSTAPALAALLRPSELAQKLPRVQVVLL